MSKLLNVSSSPHVRTQTTMKGIMYGAAIAMIPAAAYDVYQFGIKVLLIILVAVTACMLSEFVYQSLVELPVTVSDGSALMTSLVLALNIPPETPLWIPSLGGVFVIIIIKQVFGGLGQNFVNPTLAARCFLLISFTGRMPTFVLDGASGAAPLAMMRAGQQIDTTAMFIGKIPGAIGRVFTLALLIGAAYLLTKKVIFIRIPGTYILTFAIFMFLFGGMNGGYVLAQVCGDGLIFGAFFMATNYVTSPITVKGRIVFGILLGTLTGAFRLWGGSAEGVSYAIIFYSILVPLIKKMTMPVVFGFEGGDK